MKKILHKITHLLGWNYGNCESWWEDDKIIMGFRCSGCGKLSGVHKVPKYLYE